MNLSNIMNPKAALAQFGVQVPDTMEAIAQPLYDFQAYAAAGQTSLTFFQTPNGAGGKTIDDTNMLLAGQLPAPQMFLMDSIEVVFFPGVSPTPAIGATVSQFVNDVWAVGKSGTLTLQVMSKTQVQTAPLGAFPPGQGFDVSAALSDTTTAAAARLSVINYANFKGPKYKVAPMLIKNSQNFSVTLSWAAAVPLPSAVAGRIGIKLNGILYRAAQ